MYLLSLSFILSTCASFPHHKILPSYPGPGWGDWEQPAHRQQSRY